MAALLDFWYYQTFAKTKHGSRIYIRPGVIQGTGDSSSIFCDDTKCTSSPWSLEWALVPREVRSKEPSWECNRLTRTTALPFSGFGSTIFLDEAHIMSTHRPLKILMGSVKVDFFSSIRFVKCKHLNRHMMFHQFSCFFLKHTTKYPLVNCVKCPPIFNWLCERTRNQQ